MMTFEHRPAEAIVSFAIALILASWLWRLARNRRELWALALRTLSVFIFGICAVLSFRAGAMQWMSGATTETLAHVTSPNEKYVAVVRDWSAGGWGGSMYVDLYSMGGLREQVVASGPEYFLDPQDVRWKSESELVLSYADTLNEKPVCVNVAAVRVTCLPKE